MSKLKIQVEEDEEEEEQAMIREDKGETEQCES